MSTRVLRVEFHQPRRKGAAFRGWVGKITAWEEKSAPKLAFGAWKPTPNSLHSGFIEIRDVAPYEIFLYGANSPKMSRVDKFTYFGSVGFTDTGDFRCVKLEKEDGDARELWLRGGIGPSSDMLASADAALQSLSADGKHVSVMSFFSCADHVFRGHGLGGIYNTDNGMHLQALAKLQARLETISLGIEKLSPFAKRAAEFGKAWHAAHASRRKDRLPGTGVVEPN